jgi:hypothetical protein
MDATHFWPGGNPGEPVPSVEVADIKSVWTIYEEIRSRVPEGNVGVDISTIKRACSAHADLPAVTYRSSMLGLLEMCPGDLLAPWKRGGALDEAVFKVAATIAMKWMGTEVPQSGLPFDVDAFIQEVDKESA